mmetsp:Transcript_1258/g.4937  ORF Transcript_1258/g.4937 Transcript_1258/m.4937 type:complete len:253 (-) Transcript_1258:12-770(-)
MGPPEDDEPAVALVRRVHRDDRVAPAVRLARLPRVGFQEGDVLVPREPGARAAGMLQVDLVHDASHRRRTIGRPSSSCAVAHPAQLRAHGAHVRVRRESRERLGALGRGGDLAEHPGRHRRVALATRRGLHLEVHPPLAPAPRERRRLGLERVRRRVKRVDRVAGDQAADHDPSLARVVAPQRAELALVPALGSRRLGEEERFVRVRRRFIRGGVSARRSRDATASDAVASRAGRREPEPRDVRGDARRHAR